MIDARNAKGDSAQMSFRRVLYPHVAMWCPCAMILLPLLIRGTAAMRSTAQQSAASDGTFSIYGGVCVCYHSQKSTKDEMCKQGAGCWSAQSEIEWGEGECPSHAEAKIDWTRQRIFAAAGLVSIDAIAADDKQVSHKVSASVACIYVSARRL